MTQIYDTIARILELVRKYNILYFCDLVDYCRENERIWFQILCNDEYAYIIKNYVESRRAKLLDNK